MKKIKITQKQAEDLQNYVQEHMERCYEVIDFEGDELPEYLSDVDMFCGCHICDMREHLLATFNFLRENKIVDVFVG